MFSSFREIYITFEFNAKTNNQGFTRIKRYNCNNYSNVTKTFNQGRVGDP